MRNLFLLWILIGFVGTAFAANDQFMIYAMKGKAEVDSGSGYQPTKIGAMLNVGAKVRTLAESTAIVICPDRSVLKLNASTETVLEKPTEIHLNVGALFAKVQKSDHPVKEPHFIVRTPTAVAGVRGTEFFTSYSGGSKQDGWLCVHEGEVEVAPKSAGLKPVSVKAGFGIVFEPDKQIAPPQQYKWTEGLNWNMDSSAGEIMDQTTPENLYKDFLRHNYD